MNFPNMQQTGNFQIVIYKVNYPMERWCKENGWCTQLEKSDILLLLCRVIRWWFFWLVRC